MTHYIDLYPLQDNDYDAMIEAVNIGPVAINVAAGALKSYGGGVFDGCSYDDIIINHGMQPSLHAAFPVQIDVN